MFCAVQIFGYTDRLCGRECRNHEGRRNLVCSLFRHYFWSYFFSYRTGAHKAEQKSGRQYRKRLAGHIAERADRRYAGAGNRTCDCIPADENLSGCGKSEDALSDNYDMHVPDFGIFGCGCRQ